MNRQEYFRMMRHSQLTKQAMVKNASWDQFVSGAQDVYGSGKRLLRRLIAAIKEAYKKVDKHSGGKLSQFVDYNTGQAKSAWDTFKTKIGVPLYSTVKESLK